MKKSKLKRRLRKKLHVGEFQEFGFEISVIFKANFDQSDFDKFCNEFIDLVEKNKLAFGGGGSAETWEGFVTSAKNYQSPTVEQKDKIQNWLGNRNEIAEFKVGNFKDAWYDI